MEKIVFHEDMGRGYKYSGDYSSPLSQFRWRGLDELMSFDLEFGSGLAVSSLGKNALVELWMMEKSGEKSGS